MAAPAGAGASLEAPLVDLARHSTHNIGILAVRVPRYRHRLDTRLPHRTSRRAAMVTRSTSRSTSQPQPGRRTYSPPRTGSRKLDQTPQYDSDSGNGSVAVV